MKKTYIQPLTELSTVNFFESLMHNASIIGQDDETKATIEEGTDDPTTDEEDNIIMEGKQYGFNSWDDVARCSSAWD